MAKNYSKRESNYVEPNSYCPPERDINLLLLGPTGVGKTTFINAFANYIVNDTLEEAVKDEIQAIIPSSFSFTLPDSFDEKSIHFGDKNEQETLGDRIESNTQLCRSFVFPIGERNLRMIDTPGVGDTRGFEQDKRNFQEILTYIAQYEHLNGVCIMLKPNEERLTIHFRFCVNELLRHLPVDATENLIFIFTNARSTFFAPGNTKRLVEKMLKEHQTAHGVLVPFSRDNSFLFDSEPFRYLAIIKNGIELGEEQTASYVRSWDHSVKEYCRFVTHVVALPLLAVSSTLSLNEAEQLIRKLPRPIAETAKLIEENIQLAQEYKKKILINPENASEGIPQNDAFVVELKHPRTVCVGERCCRIIDIGDEKKVEYLHICHGECYLSGVVQETLYDPKLEECTAMNPEDGFCTVCDCHWLQHKHITYDYQTNRTHINSNARTRRSNRQDMSLSDIDQRISDLRAEAAKIRDVYIKLAKFLHTNSIVPINNDIVEYLQYFIREEQMKQNAGAGNQELIAGLRKQLDEFTNNFELFKKAIKEQQESGELTDVLEPEKIFDLVGTLYDLPINGRQIQEQVNGIKFSQEKSAAHREKSIRLPAKAAESKVMQELQTIVCRRRKR
ncbi:unnamed protein product [Rotaria magnacalcarata]|uniref:DUF8206 domain-containing protein n=3 Tax=Rotaria magnacalcarata TaxID=392030 RepID=A0A816SV85_9BILA|nr:unnamed protein product [Rotaria magnacalcarata]CAF4021037.1 unnamed protein product [Rotaria magnacalcarata]